MYFLRTKGVELLSPTSLSSMKPSYRFAACLRLFIPEAGSGRWVRAPPARSPGPWGARGRWSPGILGEEHTKERPLLKGLGERGVRAAEAGSEGTGRSARSPVHHAPRSRPPAPGPPAAEAGPAPGSPLGAEDGLPALCPPLSARGLSSRPARLKRAQGTGQAPPRRARRMRAVTAKLTCAGPAGRARGRRARRGPGVRAPRRRPTASLL